MQPMTIKVAKYYGAWVLLWTGVALTGKVFTYHGEYGISAHLILSFTGAPLAPFSWYIHPHGSILATLVVGLIGLIQWCVVSELSSWYDKWQENKQ
jgi:hypothetical protein